MNKHSWENKDIEMLFHVSNKDLYELITSLPQEDVFNIVIELLSDDSDLFKKVYKWMTENEDE